MSVENNLTEWIRLADMDMATAQHMFNTYYPKPLEIVCFHSQQAAEKMLKCFLATQDTEIPRTHDMQILCDKCMEIEDSFNDIYEASVMLTRYGVIPRYPVEWDILEADAKKAIEDAESVMSFVKDIISTDEKQNAND
ncbi:MAG: HEPN domain-containing protein [Oscillospiraceae bacterium]|nr:HEPN domain-containing protein [Oscillospiraceae bacterium]MCL2279572.1 HEPN domain-containing protein [Oscillospiraceae bacterium]